MATAFKFLGVARAGFISPAEEELADTMTLDDYLIENKEATYLIKVKGDSMAGAGIIDGDIALVERNATPKDGDIVIAEIDHKWVIKYFCKKKNEIYLASANPEFKPIYPKEDLKIIALVKAVVRKY